MNPLAPLHRPGDPLILPNVWDAASARAVARAGFPAVATSSAAVAETLGYADGEATPVAEMLDAIARIVSSVDAPVTADFERGYGLKPSELVSRLTATGVAGCNIEDSHPSTHSLVDAQEQADFLAAIRSTAGDTLWLNARVDSRDLDDAIARAHLYLSAGADSIYPIFLATEHLKSFVDAVDAPVNVVKHPKSPPLSDLTALGVARISYGPFIFRTMHSHLDTLLSDLR